MKYSKTQANELRLERKNLEEKYASYLSSSDPRAVETAALLHKYYEEDDARVRFRAKVDDHENGEKVTPYFFNKIKQNRIDSNINQLKTAKYPNGTNSRKQTMDALDSHYKTALEKPSLKYT